MQVNSERNGNRLWRIVMDYPDIFDNFILPKLSCNDVKFFYDVNGESRMAIKRSRERLCTSFKIRDFFTKSTLSWALKNCSENKKRFCEQMAFNGNIELLQYLHKRGCPWNEWACKAAAQNGHLECLKYLHDKGCHESANYELCKYEDVEYKYKKLEEENEKLKEEIERLKTEVRHLSQSTNSLLSLT